MLAQLRELLVHFTDEEAEVKEIEPWVGDLHLRLPDRM